jgi:hypothetical protein
MAALALIIMVTLFPANAWAYIDPGTGSFVIQGIIAAIVGAGLFIKLYWRRIVARVTGKPMDDDPDDDI